MTLDQRAVSRDSGRKGVKSRCRYPGGGAGRANDGRMVGGEGPNTESMPTAPSRPIGGDANCTPVRHVDHQRDGAAMREEDVFDRVTRPRNDRVLIERDHLELRPQQIEVRCRQCCKKAITCSGRRRHSAESAVKRPRPSPFGVSRNGGLNMSLDLLSLRPPAQTSSQALMTNSKRYGARRVARVILRS